MSDYNFGAKERFDLTKEQVLETLKNYEKIMERVEGVAGEIGFINREFNMLEEGKTEFTEDEVYVTAYDSHYDLYDSKQGSFPLDFLFEDAEKHKDWYKNKWEKAKQARKAE